MEKKLIKVRAVTRFVVLSPDASTWKAALVGASNFCLDLAKAYEGLGYEVQTLRIVTNPFGEYLDCTSSETVLRGLEVLSSILKENEGPIRIRFAVGAARNAHELSLAPSMIAAYGDLCNICINIPADEHGVVDAEMCHAAAECVVKLADTTERGEGNFNFTANFFCKPGIPYFPAGYNTREMGECFAIGLEHPDLLYAILEPLCLGNVAPKDRSAAWTNAADKLSAAIQAHVDVLAGKARDAAAASNIAFKGLDSSAAPSKDVTSMCKIIECLGVEHFGASGCVEACAFLTRVFKSVKHVPLIGFSGLMLTCLEDEGMAASAALNQYDIRALLQYSCVCGIGLDCVPIPGSTSIHKIAALMKDTGTLAFRYQKPLTVRLFPCKGKTAGDMTTFQSPDLCNCTVFGVP